MSREEQLEFMQKLTDKCSKFFYDMHTLCSAYNQQFGGDGKVIKGKQTSGDISENYISNGDAPKKRKQKAIKDPNAPKAPASSYILFFQERYEKVKGKHPELNITEISKIISQEWNKLTPEAKRPYDELALERKLNYKEKMIEYATLNPDKDVKIPYSSTKAAGKLDEQKNNMKKTQKVLEESSDDGEEESDEDSEEEVQQKHSKHSKVKTSAVPKSGSRKVKDDSSSDEESNSYEVKSKKKKSKHH